MSQVNLIDIENANPQIPTQFDTDSGTAIPLANTLEIVGGIGVTTSGSGNTVTVSLTGGGAGIDEINVDTFTAPGTNPVLPNGSGAITVTGAQVLAGTVGANVIRTDSLAANSYTIQVQQASSSAVANASVNGVAHFNSGQFTVNQGFVSLTGSGLAVDSFAVDTGTSPIVPDGTGLVTISGSSVAPGTNPVRSNGTGANALTLEVQRSQAIAAADSTKVGLCNFDSSSFSVAATGFVTASTTGLLKTLTGDTGGALSPTSNNINTLGSGSITIAGSGSTLTTQLTGLTNHAVLVGAGTSTITKIAATANTGAILQNNSSADPSYSTATYPSTTTVSQILYSSAANTVSGLATANNSVVLTNGSGVPSLGTSLTNDFTYTSSTAATVRTLTVTNTDNTNTGSGALIKAVSGGASAGDAVYQASTTTTDWSFGVDNSVTSPTADPFVISQGTALGTNNIMSVATSGEINYPLQPAFLAYLATTANNKTGTGTSYQLGTDALTEVFDQNSDFNTNGTFTAPVTGKYALNTSSIISGCTIATGQTTQISTSNRIYSSQFNRPAGNSNLCAPISVLADMDAADTAVVNVMSSGEAGDTDDILGSSTLFTYFSGALSA